MLSLVHGLCDILLEGRHGLRLWRVMVYRRVGFGWRGMAGHPLDDSHRGL